MEKKKMRAGRGSFLFAGRGSHGNTKKKKYRKRNTCLKLGPIKRIKTEHTIFSIEKNQRHIDYFL